VYKLALTGGIACGKSLVAAYLGQRGVTVCDTDKIGHMLLEPGQETHREVVAVFGKHILDANGRIDRSRLGRAVFQDPEQLQKLNTIMHPQIQKRWCAWMQEKTRDGEAVAAIMIPLLFEVGADQGWDSIICVVSPQDEQVQRLCARGLSKEEALIRIKAQLPNKIKSAKADYTLMNDGTREALKEQTFILLDRLLESK
jgi:dephospho-CoA kinase